MAWCLGVLVVFAPGWGAVGFGAEAAMTPDELRAMMAFLESRVVLADPAAREVAFGLPGEAEMVAAGLPPEGVRRLLAQPWLSEMVEEVVETPEFCDPEDSPEQVLRYARDVVVEFFRKRFPL